MKTIYREWISTKLLALRNQQGMKRKDLASKLNLKTSAYRAYEEKRAEPSLFTLKKICEIFNLSIDSFMSDSPQ